MPDIPRFKALPPALCIAVRLLCVLLCGAETRSAFAAEPSKDTTTVEVVGQVVARGTKEPMAAASISVNASLATETDDQGRFSLSLEPGAHVIQVQQPGYEPAELDLALDPATIREELILRLNPRQTGERYETVVEPADPQAERTTIRGDELTRTPGSLGDPLRVVESLPGVSQVVWPLAVYAIRGANPGNTGFFVDGVRLPMLYHFALGPSVIHPFFVGQVDFYPGGYPSRFGRYVSGIVNAKTRTPRSDRVRGSVDVRLLDAGGIVVTPFNEGKGTVAVAGRLSYSGLLFSLFSPDFSVNYWDYQVRVDHPLGPGRLSLFVFGSGDRLRSKKNSDTNVDIMFHRASLTWRGRLGRGRFTVGTVLGYDSSSTFIPQVNNLPVATRSVSSQSRVRYQRQLARALSLDVGADLEIQRIRPEAVSVLLAEQDVLNDRTVIMHGGYLATPWRPTEGLIVTPGFRYDLYRQEGTSSFQPGPRLNIRGRVAEVEGSGESNGIWLKGSFGRFSQLPSLPVAVPGFENFGLASLGMQTGVQASSGIEAPLFGLASLDLTGFVQRFDVTDLRSIFDFDVQTELLERRPGRSFGAEIMLRRSANNRFYGWFAYTISRSERSLPLTNARARADWDQRHILNLVLSYRLGGGYQIGGRFHYNSGRPYPVFDEGSVGSNRQPVDYVDLPDFHQIDFRFDKRWIFDRYVLDFYIEMINSTFSRQVFDMKRRNDGSLEKIGFSAALPSVGLHAEW